MSTYDPIDEALNTSSIEVSNTPENGCVTRKESLKNVTEVNKDYEYTRANLYSLIADTTDKLMELQKKVREVDEEMNKTTNNVTNNAVFVGSTTELSKMLKDGFLNNNKKS